MGGGMMNGFMGMMGTQRQGMGGMGLGGSPTFDSVQGGGMDVMGSLKNHSNFATGQMRQGGNAMSMPMGGIFGFGG